MSYGFEVYNDQGIPQTIDGGQNMVFHQKGVVNIGSNTSATGRQGSVLLPANPQPYLIFVRTSQNVCILASSTSGFTWFMPQGSTQFEWWAYARSTSVSQWGLQVFNADGSLRWDLGQRPLAVMQTFKPSGGIPYQGELSTANVITGAQYSIPANSAVLLSDLGMYYDLYTGFPGSATVQPNMRYFPCASINGTALNINWGRVRGNRPATLPAGVSYTSMQTKNPNWVLVAPAF